MRAQSSLDHRLRTIERAAQDITDPDELTTRVGGLVADALEADAHVFLRLDPLSALWIGATGAGYSDGACEHFTSKVFLQTPLADYAEAGRSDARVVVVNAGEAHDAVYARYYFDELGYAAGLQATFAVGEQVFGHLTLSKAKGRFDPAAVRFVESTLQPVTQALRRHLAKETLESVPGDEAGLLFVDGAGAVTAANATGETLLARLVEVDPVKTRTTLAAVIELARRELVAPSGRAIPRVVYVEPGSRRRYRLVAERLLASPSGQPLALIMAEPIRALDSVELLRTAGLSEREAEVALVMLRGLKSAEGAAALGMSEHTLLSHLKSVYRKLQVSSRGELASLILSGV